MKIIPNCKLGEKSWVKKSCLDNYELLEHEAGHYYIAWICMLEFAKRVSENIFSKIKYRDEVKNIFTETTREYQRIQK